MKKVLLFIGLFFVVLVSSAQSWIQGQYTQSKGMIADSAARLPRQDTVWKGGNKDSIGAILYRTADDEVYVKKPTGWKRITSGTQLTLDSAYMRNDTMFFPISTGGEIAVKVTGLPQENVNRLVDSIAGNTLQRVTQRGANSTVKTRFGDSETPTNALTVSGPPVAAATSGDAENGALKIVGKGSDNALFIGVDTTKKRSWFQTRSGNDFGINYDLNLNPNGGKVIIGRNQGLGYYRAQNIDFLTIQNDSNNVATRIYLMPHGTVAGGAFSAFKLFGSDFLADTINYDDFNITNTATEIWLNQKKNGTGAQKDIVFLRNDSEKILFIKTGGSKNVLINGAADDAILGIRSHTSEAINATLPVLKVSSGLNVKLFEVLNNGSINLTGSVHLNTRTVTAGTTMTGTDYTLLVNNSSGSVTIALPTASSATNRVYVVKKVSATSNDVIIDPSGLETIDAATTKTLSLQYSSITFQSNGASWNIIASYAAATTL